VFTTPLVAALRRRFPAATLVYLVEERAAPVVLANPHLNEVKVIPHSRGLRRIRDDYQLARSLKRRRFDVAIDLHGGPRSAWLTWWSGAKVRVGYDVPGRSWMYTEVVRRPKNRGPRHAVLNQWDLLRAVDRRLGVPPTPEHDPVEMHADATAARTLSDRLRALGVPSGAQPIVLHVSAGNPFRRWPESAFVDLGCDLLRRGDARWLLVTSGPSDEVAAARVVQGVRERVGSAARRIVEDSGLSLAELRALMDRAALFIGGDSGPLHVASTSTVPIVGLYGPTLPERSAPWRPASLLTASVDVGELPCRPCNQRRCLPRDFRCLTTLRSSAVLDAAERLLSGAGRAIKEEPAQ
jgi:lipopolysaccharide heptosyltransferase II